MIKYKRGTKLRFYGTDITVETMEDRKLEHTVDAVFTRCKVIASTNRFYPVGSECDLNLDFGSRL